MSGVIITHEAPVGLPLPPRDMRVSGEAPTTRASEAAPATLLCEVCDQREPRPGAVRPTPLRTVVCGPCWAQHGGEADADEIGPAPQITIPVREPASQGEWLRCLEAEAWVQDLRCDARRRLLKLATALRNWADWHTYTCRPTWPALCVASEWARSTMASWIRQLRLSGWLTIVEPGSTPEHRPMGSPAGAEGNRAAVYALRVPMTADEAVPGHSIEVVEIVSQRAPQAVGKRQEEAVTISQLRAVVDETWTPSWSFNACKESFVGTSTRASKIFHSSSPEVLSDDQMEALRARSDEKRRRQFSAQAPVSETEMYVAACQLRREHPILARLSVRAVRALARPYWLAKWGNDDLLHGLKYRPTSWSTALPCPTEYAVIHPWAWCNSRLAAWRDDRGRVLPGRAQGESELRRQVAEHGRAGQRLLVKGAAKPLAEHVASFGRRCAERAAAATVPGPQQSTPRAPAASAQVRATAVEHVRVSQKTGRRLIDQATAYARRSRAAVDESVEPAVTSDDERHQRARNRARGRRIKRRW